MTSALLMLLGVVTVLRVFAPEFIPNRKAREVFKKSCDLTITFLLVFLAGSWIVKRMPLIEEYIEKNKDIAIRVLKIFLSLLLDVSEGLENESQRFSMLTAENRFQEYQNLVKAGFTKPQAFQVVLAGIQPSSVVESITKSISSMPDKKN